jgi:molybdopterin synthase catalytic subunit
MFCNFAGVSPLPFVRWKRRIENNFTGWIGILRVFIIVVVVRHEAKVSHVNFTRHVAHLGYDEAVTERRNLHNGDTWIELTEQTLPVGAAYDWALLPSCGAVVVFSGTVRDHSEGRTDVRTLTYEAYEEEVVPKCVAIVEEMRRQWSDIGRVALLHRIGELQLTESSVLVVVSSPHRPAAFEAARFGIDALKSTVPIWKHESWGDGGDWAQSAQHITTIDELTKSKSLS